MIGLRSDYLNELSSYCLSNFQGVYPCDFLNLQKNGSYISNLSASSKPGSHYVSICVKDDYINYFDPFGIKCSDIYIKLAFAKTNKPIYYVNQCIQDILSTHCGYHCLAYLISDFLSIPTAKFLSLYDKYKLLNNDEITVNIIDEFIKFKNS